MGRRSTIAPELRAAALADLLAGEQPAAVAARHGIDAATVRSWKARYVEGVAKDATGETPPATLRPGVLERQKTYIGEAILDLLRAKLAASQAIATAVADPAWLKRQPASELAALGQWLDATTFAIGDRLAGAAQRRAADGDD